MELTSNLCELWVTQQTSPRKEPVWAYFPCWPCDVGFYDCTKWTMPGLVKTQTSFPGDACCSEGKHAFSGFLFKPVLLTRRIWLAWEASCLPLVGPINEFFGVAFSCLPLGKTVTGDLKKVAGWVAVMAKGGERWWRRVGSSDGRGSRNVAAAVAEQVAGRPCCKHSSVMGALRAAQEAEPQDCRATAATRLP